MSEIQAFRDLIAAANEVSRRGAETGPQWTKLTMALLKAKSAITAKEKATSSLREALDECEDYFDNRADVEYFTDSPTPVPNEEMRLLSVVRAALEKSP